MLSKVESGIEMADIDESVDRILVFGDLSEWHISGANV